MLETVQPRKSTAQRAAIDAMRGRAGILEQRCGSKRAADFGRLCAADSTPVACEVGPPTSAAIIISCRQPLAECRIVAKGNTYEIGKLSLRFDPKAKRHRVAFDQLRG